mmetsp:Transcript_20021/g.44899  ORF Transcript_20021/g.44899 Transcript_20021/m.44899 type:complete len:268 (+) Transcript_20021:58-861(+)
MEGATKIQRKNEKMMKYTRKNKLNRWVRKLRDAISAYEEADREYFQVCNFQRKSIIISMDLATPSSKVTPMIGKHCGIDLASSWESLEKARKAVEITCDAYISSLQHFFQDWKKQYAMSFASIEAEKKNAVTALFDKQRRAMFQDAEDHFERAITRHKIQFDRDVAMPNEKSKNAIDSSTKVLNAIEYMKVTINVSWWLFLQEIDRYANNRNGKGGFHIDYSEDSDKCGESEDGDYNDDQYILLTNYDDFDWEPQFDEEFKRISQSN